MTRLFTEGFEMGDLLNLTGYSGGVSASTTQKRSGAYALALSGNGTAATYSAYKAITATSEIYIRCGLYMHNNTSRNNSQRIVFADDTTELVSVRIIGNVRTFGAYVNGSSVATSVDTYSVATWYLVEVYVKIADSGGRIVVRIDGETVINYTGDTKPGAATTFSRIYFNFWHNDSDASTYTFYFDDIAINDRNGDVDNTWCGDGHIIALTPNASGDFNDFTPSTGSAINNFQMVDEIPSDSDTTYIESTTADHKDLYNLSDSGLAEADNEISRIWVESRGKDTTTGSGIIKLLISEDGTITESADIELTTSYNTLKSGEYLVDPVTSERWLAATLNNLQAGVKVVQ